jgi:serine/threonine-protein kinase
MQKIMNEPHPRLSSIRQDLPASLEPILDRALAKSLDDRYPAAEEMAADLTAVIAELQQDQVLELLPEAQRLMEAGEFPRARAVLHQLLKIDSKHVEARAMLGEIQRQLSLRQRENKIQQIRQQAEDALSNNRFDQSLTVLESGLDLDATNPELVNLRERARREKEKQNLIDEFLHQIDSARRKGDFKSAMAVAQKALKADKSNPRIIALRNVLTMEVEQAQRRAQAKSLLDSARAEIGSRRYNEAIELLKQVEEVDSTNPELPLLLGDANSGLEQGRRREVVTRLEEEVAQAAGYEKLQQAAQSIQEAMTSLPSESALFRLNSMVERQIKEYENRSLVDETVQACRNLHPREALELVRKARLRLPGEERLLSMEALFADRVRQQTVEERRADYLARARENLEKGLYAEAVRILEFCHAEGIANGEIFSLLDFSRSEDLESRRQQQLRNNLDHAQALIGDSAYEEAISFLEDELQQTDDNAMRMLLDQASAGRDALRRHIDAELASAVKLVLAGKQKQALEFLKNEPSAVLCAERVQTALDTLEDERRQALFRTLGRAYAALECNLSVGEAMMQRAVTAAGHASLFAPMADAFSARARSAADRVIAEAIRNAKLLLRARTRVAARLALQTVSGMVDYASSRVRSDWQNMQRKASQTGLITRLCG